jgi:hypothetical protein
MAQRRRQREIQNIMLIAETTVLAALAIQVRLTGQVQQLGEKEHGRDSLTNLDELGKMFRQVGGACIPKGQECRPNIPCCPGLKCMFGGLRSFCEPGPPPPPPPTINTVPPPSAGAVKLPYSFIFTAQNGILPLLWSETGALPAGSSLPVTGASPAPPRPQGRPPSRST